jgi:5-hydroxyisourate hydrolase
MKSISTHVLDISIGKPAKGVPVTLERMQSASGSDYVQITSGATDADGRVKDLVPAGQLTEGTYRITFNTHAYFSAQNIEGFYPEASIVFVIRDAEAHYHVPLLLSPFGYSTYRGS